jgi:prevent-host-death family protein
MALPEQRPTETMNESQSREQYSEILDRVQRDEEQIIIEKNGVPVAAIVPMSVLRDAESTARRRANLRAAFESTREEFRDIPPDEIEREIEKAIAEVGEARSQRSDQSSAPARQ